MNLKRKTDAEKRASERILEVLYIDLCHAV
jgi:hypothetical protein